ncbi:MAG: undecaprenyl-phosphate glucose phosphotransferase [Planctomycetota bacterium]|nr:MAG: undecaprenyl-phosphate glucose phosphotransferase [Planctomycetota bacterium]
MLKRHHQLVAVGLFFADAAATLLAMAGAYLIRFESGWIPRLGGEPPLDAYLRLAPLALAICLAMYQSQGLYRPRRTARFTEELWRIVRATIASVLGIIALAFLLRSPAESRTTLALFALLNPVALGLSRGTIRWVLWRMRERGYNQRYALIVGTGALGRKVADRIANNPWTGLQVRGFADRAQEPEPGEPPLPAPRLGSIDEVADLVQRHEIDQVFIALPSERACEIATLARALELSHAAVTVVPDLVELMTVGATTHNFDGLPLVHLRQAALSGYAMAAKRAFDLVVGTIALLVAAPVMLAIAVAIRLTDGPPVLYRQERVGLDGRRFTMFKFRTMRRDAEARTGAVWAQPGDPRVTRLGRWLRRLSLDELPQLFNVLRGDMSLVGPRPERPELIEEFKRHVPKYMLRHAVKAGMTGWAQVHGWRGDTSLERRIEHDIFYIEHWSIGLDLRILALTLVRGFYHPNAH